MVFGRDTIECEWKGGAWCLDGKKSENVESDREEAVSLLRSLGTVDLLSYTDGSAVEGVQCGGTAAGVTRGDPEYLERIEVRSCAADVVASSYQAYVRWVRL